jgi:hypothetical protein|tara:strand:+ start:19706 stop:20686 length:981 start_codon:yes stop_codon:yes gene_type:complete
VTFNKATDTPDAGEEATYELTLALGRTEKGIKAAFVRLLRATTSEYTLMGIARTLERGGSVEDALRYLTAHLGLFAQEITDEYIQSGRDAATYISQQTGVMVTFDQVNTRAVRYLQDNQFRLIQQFTQQQVDATRQALVRGTTEGLNPRAQARAFRDSIGLTSYQEQVVHNFRTKLEAGQVPDNKLRDRRFDRTIARGNLTAAQIGKMTGRYRERMIAYRATTIARTEALRAVNSGTEDMFEQAMDSGTISRDDVLRTWNTARDERVRSSHSSINGEVRGPGEAFVTEKGNMLMFPGDPNAPAEETIQCRCVLTTELKPIQKEIAA